MSSGINKVLLLGRLGIDPEMSTCRNGSPIARMRLATSRSFSQPDGSWRETTEWHTVRAFGATAEICQRNLKRGGQVFVEGRLQTRSWEDEHKQRHYATEVIAVRVTPVGARLARQSESEHETAERAA